MIQLQRVRTAKAIPKAFRGPGRIESLLLLLEGRRAGALEFDAKVWKAAKNQLKKESCGKCAYCEAPTAVVAHGDVEHFRPKDLYWWLAYCYDNCFLGRNTSVSWRRSRLICRILTRSIPSLSSGGPPIRSRRRS